MEMEMCVRLGQRRRQGRRWKENGLLVLCQGSEDYRIDGRRQLFIKVTSWGGLSIEVLVHQLFHATFEGCAASQEFVGHDCQGVLVGGENRRAAPLFGSHGGWSTANGAARTGNGSDVGASNAKVC